MASSPEPAPNRPAALVAAVVAGVLLHGAALAQGTASDTRSTPGQTRDASTPGQKPTAESATRSTGDARSTPGASTDSRSTDGRTGTDTRSTSRERPNDQRSRTPSN